MWNIPSLPREPVLTDPITQIEVENSLRRLRMKATGIDGLPAIMLKSHWNVTKIVDKLTHTFNVWVKEGKTPAYIKQARLIPLSKDPGIEYPA